METANVLRLHFNNFFSLFSLFKVLLVVMKKEYTEVSSTLINRAKLQQHSYTIVELQNKTV
jgi:hypothetical protein